MFFNPHEIEPEPFLRMRQDLDQEDWLAELDEHEARHYDFSFASQPPVDVEAATCSRRAGGGTASGVGAQPVGPSPHGSSSNDSRVVLSVDDRSAASVPHA